MGTCQKEFQRGRPAELDDDAKASAARHMMLEKILDAVDLGAAVS